MELKSFSRKYPLRILVLLALIFMTAGWGSVGHRIINTKMVVHLPAGMEGFVQRAAFLAAHASDADNRKGADSRKPYILKEGPRHFIDVDAYAEFATQSVPTNFSTIIAQHDSATVFDRGINPWATVWTLDSLTAQMRRGDWEEVWLTAADLGHYVGDAHQPLHNTEDYDGRGSLPGSKGIHSRYETSMLGAYQNSITIVADSVHFIANPIDFMFGIVYQSNSYVDSIYDADVFARQTSGWNGSGSIPSSYTSALWDKTEEFTLLQFQRATQNYADLLYTAWINAGTPLIPVVTKVATGEAVPTTIWLGQNYPNPFNPGTKISFRLAEPAHVTLAVYSLEGKEIALLMDRSLNAGTYESKFEAGSHSLASGIYLYRLHVHAGNSSRTFTNKMLLLK